MTRCDKCGEMFNIVPKQRKIKDDIVEDYFSCNHCGATYRIMLSNSKIRHLLEQNNPRLRGLIKVMVEDLEKNFTE